MNRAEAGLGNRMRFTLSVASIAQYTGRSLKVYWPLGKLFSCPIERLWTNFPGQLLRDEELFPLKPEEVTNAQVITPEFWSTATDEPLVIVRGYGVVPPPVGVRAWGELFRDLHVTPEIGELIERTWDALPRTAGVLGVSMRVHELSHPKTKERSPVSWYVDELHRFLVTNPRSGIFLSCDDQEVSEAMKAQFSNLVTVDYPSDYNSERGVIKAVADMYVLASSTEILAPYYSSFPEMSYVLAANQVPMRDSVRSWPAARSTGPTVASTATSPYRRVPVTGWQPGG